MSDAEAGAVADTWVVVRSHDPLPGGLGRVCAWAKQLEGLVAGMTVSVDTSGHDKGVVLSKFRENGLPDWVQVHEYSEADMIAKYPVLDEEMKAHPTFALTKELSTGKYSFAWGFHCCALNLWFQGFQQEKKPAFVWVLEDDVGFTGNLADFLRATASETADLLADTYKPVTETWWWWDFGSKAYLSAVSLEERCEAREHVQRFSCKLLDGLHHLAETQRCIAWSEQGTPSLCRHLGLESKQIDLDYISSANFSWDTRIEEDKWAEFMSADTPESRNRFYHALKF
mmetsp:Transcript_22415/g.43992  ORF Transcript_22415/g.43992 Transcript_22415/m.43992 type:complete len:285 (-) Transcript_22415:345-1199(-)